MKGTSLALAGEYLRKNSQVAKIAAITILVTATSAWTSCSGRATTKRINAEIDKAVAINRTASRFREQFLPATTAETDEWSRTTAEAAEFGVPVESRLSLAGSVSRTAEAAGMSGVKVRFVPPDSVGAADVRNLGNVTFQPATYGLRLEGSGSVSAISRVAERLAPAAEIMVLTLVGDSDQLRATFELVVYQSAGGPKN